MTKNLPHAAIAKYFDSRYGTREEDGYAIGSIVSHGPSFVALVTCWYFSRTLNMTQSFRRVAVFQQTPGPGILDGWKCISDSEA